MKQINRRVDIRSLRIEYKLQISKCKKFPDNLIPYASRASTYIFISLLIKNQIRKKQATIVLLL